MFKGFKAFALTHKEINLRDLSRYVLPVGPEETLRDRLLALRDAASVQELLYLATCNRVLFLYYQEPADIETSPLDLLATALPGLSPEHLAMAATHGRCLEGSAVLEHLFEVSASMDSLVVGEREIFRQLREAYDLCLEWGLIGDNLRVAMKFAVQTAKDIYANTGIGEKPLSVVSLAVQKLMEFSVSSGASIALVGAGQTNLLVSKFLSKYGFTNVTVFNRTLERAQRIADKFAGGRAYDLAAFDRWEEGFDVLFVCTTSQQPLVASDWLARQPRTDKKVVFIDLAVPQNVHADLHHKPNTVYIDIEHLRTLAESNLAYRRQELQKARGLLNNHLRAFRGAYHQRLIERAMQEVPREIKAVRRKAVEEVFRKDLEQLDEPTRNLVQEMLLYMEKKCISIPIKAAKQIAHL